VTTRRLVNPLLLVGLIALFLLSARIMTAQTTPTAAGTRRVAVATRAIARGAVLSAGDFEVRDTTVRGTSQTDSTPVVAGWVARRSFSVGEVLRAPAVEAPNAVSANSSVQVEWADRNVMLTVRGVAARNGSIGERVPVRTEMGKRIEATVVAPGRVRID
jgi:flagella basal body P-ring formation protein FlgA